MNKIFFLILLSSVGCLLSACNHQQVAQTKTPYDPAKDWKLGVALWTFHNFSFPEALDKVESTGLHYVEIFPFQKAGPALKDSLISQLSPEGIDALKLIADKKNLKIESMYVAGGGTIDSWKKEFDIARRFHVKYVTAEPPLNMWDGIDSLAGAYGIKVAIHDHWRGMSAYWHPDSVLAAIKNHPNFGACADLGHWPKSGVDPVEGLKKLEGHIIGIHLKDIAEFNNTKIQDVPVGTGVINFPAVFAELKKQKFAGNIYIECDAENLPDNLPSVRQAIKYYKEKVGGF